MPWLAAAVAARTHRRRARWITKSGRRAALNYLLPDPPGSLCLPERDANSGERGDLVVAAQYQKDIARILGVQYRPPSPACTYTRPRLVHARHCPWELYQLCKLVTKLTCTRVLACVRVHAHQQRASGRVRGATSAAPLRHCVRACECEVQMRKELVDPRRKAAQRRRPS